MNSNPSPPDSDPAGNPAVELIRAKVARAFTNEPDAAAELAEAQQTGPGTAGQAPSKHQQFMRALSQSGKSLAEIQTEWHHYYTTLSDREKHEVWQEFYEANRHTPYQQLFRQQRGGDATGTADADAGAQPAGNPLVPAPPSAFPAGAQLRGDWPAATGQSGVNSGVVVADHTPPPPGAAGPLTGKGRSLFGGHGPGRGRANPATKRIKQQIAATVTANGKLTMKHHLQSLLFGLFTGTIVLIVFLFTFFNEYIIAPFIQPSRHVSSTPIILSNSSAAADTPPSATVPKINIQIPIDFTETSYAEDAIENDLKSGVVHYPNTVLPGQNGNGAYFGHSSGNIFNSGRYKFAFTLLHNLTTGDLFYITYGGKTYAYRVFDRQIVPPSDVGVINDSRGKQATAELITCDPPGVSTNRLVVWGEQISPDPSTNTAAPAANPALGQPTEIAGNGPTLWSRFVNWVEFWN